MIFGRRIAIISLLAIAVVVALVALVPVRTADLASHPQPMSAYETAAVAISRRQHSDAQVAAPSGGTIFLGHGRRTPTAVLLLHGYTNSPLQFDSLGGMLFRDGANVYIPRLPHHAELVDRSTSLSRLTAEELRAAADSAVDVAAGLGDTIVVVGLSMGGTMAAWIGQYRSGVRRVVLVAPLMAVARVPKALDVPLLDVAVRMPNVGPSNEADAAEPDRTLGWSSHSVGQILRLGLAVQRASLGTPPATRDVATLLNANDHTISSHPVLEMDRRWREHGATVHEYELSAALGLPHDVIDPRQPVRRPDVVYPVIEALVSGRTPTNREVERLSSTTGQRLHRFDILDVTSR